MLNNICEIVKEVGQTLRKIRSNNEVKGKWVAPNCFKAEADRIAHNMITEKLYKVAPDIPIVSEEDQRSLLHKRPFKYWLIDPIDGTASYASGFDGYVSQIALMIDKEPVMSAIYVPEYNILYHSKKGFGALKNNNRFKIEPSNKNFRSIIDNYPEPRGISLHLFKEFGLEEYLECGSISLKICKVADGTADIFFKNVLVHDWDLAAPQLIIEEAGGFMSDCLDNPITYYGNYNKNGVCAAKTKEVQKIVVEWYKNTGKEL